MREYGILRFIHLASLTLMTRPPMLPRNAIALAIVSQNANKTISRHERDFRSDLSAKNVRVSIDLK